MPTPERGEDAVRIGVYVCHCGSNIAATVDVRAVAEHASKLAGVVVARDYRYMCSDPGQELIKQDIRDHQLNRIVVASCSPHLHEKTFRGAVWAGGLNPFQFQMVNIREHASWVHTDRRAATEKADALVRGAVSRVRHHKPLETRRVPVRAEALVVGGGIAGIHAALTMADAGKHVYLVEREPTIGGHMAMFDKTFPTLDCAACILTPKMTAVKSHKNITLWAYSEVQDVSGYVGNFKVKVRRKPRYIREDACIGCQECIDACIYKTGRVDDEFNLGMSKRRPIYLSFPQAVPQLVTIDPEACIEFKSHKCKKTCVEACGDRNAIDFTQQETVEEIEVGTIILATGFQVFDARRLPQYGYRTYPNVYTALEVERLLNASGPTAGEVVLRNGKAPRSVGIIHCIGSRDEHTNKYCSRVCCMYSLKLAHLLQERTGAEVFNFYIDMRTPGKAFEEFYNRVAEEGAHFIRGKVAEVLPSPEGNGQVVLQAEDTLAGRMRRIPVDMVVLATGLEPRADAEDVRRRFNITCAGGWFTERHPKLAPVSTFTDGVWIAGACQGPKDIPDTVAQAGAASGEALALINAGQIELEPNTAYIVEEDCSGCKTCVGMCPYSAIAYDEEKSVARVNEVLCKGCGTCVSVCPSGSARQNLFEDEEIYDEIGGVLAYA